MSKATDHFFIGWDVGAWNCDDNNKSKDALCVLGLDDEQTPVVRGNPWRGNLRAILDEQKGRGIVEAFLNKCKLEHTDAFNCTIAIDTPLGWPSPMRIGT